MSAFGNRGQIGDELPFAPALAEADDDDPTGLETRDHTLAEGGVHDVVAEAECRGRRRVTAGQIGAAAR
jgi:hypothetical protein